MKKATVALTCMVVAIILSACGSGLRPNQVALETQRVDRCSYGGAAFIDGNAVRGDVSANCTVIKDGYDTVTATTSLQYSFSKDGDYYTQGVSSPVTINAKPYQRYNISFDHVSVERYCEVQKKVWYRAKMTIIWRNAPSGQVGGITYYYSPKTYGLCGS